MGEAHDTDRQGGLTEEEKRANVITLAFGGRTDLFDAFCKAIEEVVPPHTTVVLRTDRARAIWISPWSAATYFISSTSPAFLCLACTRGRWAKTIRISRPGSSHSVRR
jgi:hypothetical protein